ncbi:hypothetical protein B296_00015139 [Ensete ventricosum]|uniref:Uncharacterized protein n=1 Tax=Ensete ventricosum TaxID=4639 RepID=A0A427A9L8_ENSVE|nr:hypothetical protein B296_00015139 [Ensete ventricosum]
MGILSVLGNSFGCSTSGEQLLSAAREGDLEEAKALIDYNPRLARYSTFGVKNSPLHFSASHGHHEVIHRFLVTSLNLVRHAKGLILRFHLQIVSVLVETGANINLRNYIGQVRFVFNGICRKKALRSDMLAYIFLREVSLLV